MSAPSTTPASPAASPPEIQAAMRMLAEREALGLRAAGRLQAIANMGNPRDIADKLLAEFGGNYEQALEYLRLARSEAGHAVDNWIDSLSTAAAVRFLFADKPSTRKGAR